MFVTRACGEMGGMFVAKCPQCMHAFEIFRADAKRCRPTYDSYQLVLDRKFADSRAWT